MEITANLNRLAVLAARVQQANPHALIGGSLALALQGIDIGREPVDLDIILLETGSPLRFPGLVETDLYEFHTDYDEDGSEGYTVKSHELEGFKVDVFTPHRSTPTPPSYPAKMRGKFSGDALPRSVRVQHVTTIMWAKLNYALAGGPSSAKHCNDISNAMLSLKNQNGFKP